MSDAPSYLPPYARSSRGLPSPVKSTPARAADDPDDDADDLDREEDEHPLPARRPIRAGARGPAAHLPHAPRGALRGGAGRIAHAGFRCAARASAPPFRRRQLQPRRRSPPRAVRSRHAAAAGIAPVTTAASIPASAVVPAVTSDGAVLAGLTASLEAIAASLDDLSRHGRPLRERVALDLARAEVTRARWVTDAAAVLRADPLPVARCRRPGRGMPQRRRGLRAGVPAGRRGGRALGAGRGRPGVRRRAAAADRSRRAAGRRARAGRGHRGDASRVTVTLGPAGR